MDGTNQQWDVSWERQPQLRLLQALNVLFARSFHSIRVATRCTLPRTGPAILVCNHTSGLDPALIQSVSPRPIVWMMAKEFYTNPKLNWFLRVVHAIPVDRGGRDLTATRQALRMLDHGRVLGIFPEGKIERDKNFLPFQTGVAMMALKTGVGVYPACLDGSQRQVPMVKAYLTRQSAQIAFGTRVDLARYGEGKPDHSGATEAIRNAVIQLRNQLK